MNDGIVMFDNRKEGNTEKHPVMKGFITIEGQEFECALWPKTGKDGKRFWSGRVNPKQERMKRDPKPRVEFDEAPPF